MLEPGRSHASRPERLAQQTEAERRRLAIIRIDDHVGRLETELKVCDDRDERIGLKAEIVHLLRWRERIISGRWYPMNKRRKPPEAGIAAPAIAPRGPLPQEGGAAAPLDFDRP